jgi:acetyl esterase
MTQSKLPVMDGISPQMRAAIDKSNELAPGAYDTQAGFDVLRSSYTAERRFWNEGGPLLPQTINTVLPTPHGDVPIRFHIPTVDVRLPAIVYIHGGGFVLGNLDTHDKIMRLLAELTGATVVGLDYSLSPEAKFPVALEQCAALARHLHQEGAHLNIDGDHLALAGDSGGAMLALATLLHLRDEGGDSSYVKALLLYYGLYGLRDSVSRRLLGGTWDGLTKEDLDYYMDCYLARPEDADSPYVDCLGADLTHGLPPCYIAAAEFDPLRDDSAALALLLRAHQVPCQHDLFPGVIHGFLHHSRLLDTALEALRHGADFFCHEGGTTSHH